MRARDTPRAASARVVVETPRAWNAPLARGCLALRFCASATAEDRADGKFDNWYARCALRRRPRRARVVDEMPVRPTSPPRLSRGSKLASRGRRRDLRGFAFLASRPNARPTGSVVRARALLPPPPRDPGVARHHRRPPPAPCATSRPRPRDDGASRSPPTPPPTRARTNASSRVATTPNRASCTAPRTPATSTASASTSTPPTTTPSASTCPSSTRTTPTTRPKTRPPRPSVTDPRPCPPPRPRSPPPPRPRARARSRWWAWSSSPRCRARAWLSPTVAFWSSRPTRTTPPSSPASPSRSPATVTPSASASSPAVSARRRGTRTGRRWRS